MKLKPISNWALIRPAAAREKTVGGIYIPDSAKTKPVEGEVLAIGEGRFEQEETPRGKPKGEKKFVKTSVKPGTRVLYEKYAGTTVEIEGEELVLVRENNILGQYDS